MESIFNNDNLIWVKVKDIVELAGMAKTTIQRYCKVAKYNCRLVNCRGGQQYEILFSSLEPEVQEKIKAKWIEKKAKDETGLPRFARNDGAGADCNKDFTHRSTLRGDEVYTYTSIFPKHVSPLSLEKQDFLCGADGTILNISGNNSFPTPYINAPLSLNNCNDVIITKEQTELLKNYELLNTNNDNYIIPQKAREKALFKVDLINSWEAYRENAKSKTEADKKFIELYNSKKYNAITYNLLGKVSIRTLNRWYKTYLEGGKDFKVLIDNYSYGCESQLITSLSNIEKYLLLKYMLNQNKFSIARAYEHIVRELEAKGYKAQSLSVYRHVWDYVQRNFSDMVAYARGGKKYALDNALPHITKDYSQLSFGDMIVGDGHTLDFMVKNPETGKPCRATLVGFMDEASRDLVGYDVMITENTQVIASALRRAILYLGKMPKVVHLDNGRAFKSEIFTGKVDLMQSGIQGLYESLGIKTLFSNPYNGRAKPIERFFKELTESFAKLFPSYIGNNIQNQPACTKRNEKFHKELQGDYVPTIEETKQAIETWLNDTYRKRRCRNNKAMTIQEYVDKNKGPGVDTNLLDDLMLVSTPRTLRKGAIQLFKTYYYCDELIGLNDKVIAKYDMFDLSYVKVYSLKGEYIGVAQRAKTFHPAAALLGDAKDLAEYKQERKRVSKVIKERTKKYQKTLKTLYPKKKLKEIEVKEKQEAKEIRQYEINNAGNMLRMLEDDEDDYVIDYTKMNLPDVC